MTETESLPPITQSRLPFSAWVGVVFLFLLFGAIALALIGPSPRHDNYEQTRAAKRVELLKKLREDDAAALTGYAIVDKAKGTARIPIERAMQLTMAELAQKKPAPAYPIASPAPSAAAPGSVTSSPAPAPVAGTAGSAASPTPTAPASHTSSGAQATPPTKLKETEGPKSEIHNQPAAAANPPAVSPGTQPGASATPMAAPAPPSGKPAVSPSGTPSQNPPGSPLPVPGKTP
ncbi:MAG TPA: hypothetical protein VGH65_02695 [Verrucomicrobiaceae bacterium]